MIDPELYKMLLLLVVLPIAILDITLKGFALWKASKLGERAWFICILIFNTAGILPGIYLLLKRNK